jgi:predicted fused transcriptional regulator/phosphomethylpyrimidine kinase
MTTRSLPDVLFRKSSYSQPKGSNCVEVADLPGFSAVRDTQNRTAGHLEFGHSEWAALLGAVRTDRL